MSKKFFTLRWLLVLLGALLVGLPAAHGTERENTPLLDHRASTPFRTCAASVDEPSTIFSLKVIGGGSCWATCTCTSCGCNESATATCCQAGCNSCFQALIQAGQCK